MIKAIIFDFDGVLVHSERANIEAALKTFKDIGKPLTSEEEASIPGRASLDFIPEFSKKRGINDANEHQELYEINRENYKMLWSSVVKMFPDNQKAIETLVSLGKALAIATTNRRETVEMFFNNFHMHNIFSFVVAGEEVKNRKPDPEAYLLAVQGLGLAKNDCITVEDTSIGLQAAKRAGLRCVVIPNEYTQKDDFSQADFILKSMAQLPNLLLEL